MIFIKYDKIKSRKSGKKYSCIISDPGIAVFCRIKGNRVSYKEIFVLANSKGFKKLAKQHYKLL